MMQESESDDFSNSDYEEGGIENRGRVMLLYVAYILSCKSRGSRSPKHFEMEPIEKIISENHRDELVHHPALVHHHSGYPQDIFRMLFLLLKKN
ncbi:hypothetical protein TNCV_3273031 [Trichonephila clavipes]|nr:hypothetical protein TNCV_3273031 [Trichonephila clavipes]